MGTDTASRVLLTIVTHIFTNEAHTQAHTILPAKWKQISQLREFYLSVFFKAGAVIMGLGDYVGSTGAYYAYG